MDHGDRLFEVNSTNSFKPVPMILVAICVQG